MIRTVPAALPLAMLLLASPGRLEGQWRGSLQAGDRAFVGGSVPGSVRHEPEFAFRLERQFAWKHGRHTVWSAASLRLNPSDRHGSLFDVPELSLRTVRDQWELGLGVRELFWGVLESAHLVNVINQRAPHHRPTGDVPLGQPMVDVTLKGAWGRLELYGLLGFRPRPFRGTAGRLWSGLPIDEVRAAFPASGRDLAGAARWSRQWGKLDVGLAYFGGTSRDPTFEPVLSDVGATVLAPRYDVIHQATVDGQWTSGPWIWKLEGRVRGSQDSKAVAVGLGTEHVLADYLSFFVEYVRDRQGPGVASSRDDDVFVGARLLYQDGQASLGALVDRRSGNTTLKLDFSRRLRSAVSLRVDVSVFAGTATREPGLARREFTSIALAIDWHF